MLRTQAALAFNFERPANRLSNELIGKNELFSARKNVPSRRTSERFVIHEPSFNEEENRSKAITDLRRLSLCK